MEINEFEESSVNQARPNPGHDEPPKTGPGRGSGIGVIAVVLLAIGAALGWFIYKGISTRVVVAKELVAKAEEAQTLMVSVTHPIMTGATQRLVLPGNTQPLMEAPIYARTNGYLKKWYADIGTHVHKGDLLAEIETPEADQQLQQAQADLGTARSNLSLAQVTAGRIVNLAKKGAVARQDMDNAVGDMNSKAAIVESAAANVKRLQDLQSYEKVYAPFDGVITARNTDVGALIAAGSGGAGKELFHIAAINRLRVFISVPEDFLQAAQNGLPVSLTLNEFPGRSFPGTIVRNASSIDATSRTLLVEVNVDNPTGILLPGAYVSVHLKYNGATASALTIPVTTVMFRSEGIRVAVVRNGKTMLVPITVGRDFGDTLEVLAGLRAQDQLIVNPPDSLISGTPVRISEIAASKK